jgi:SNF2 family DNA or RNA helicase
VGKYMVPAIRFDKKDCIDMPPITFEERMVPMTPEQKKAYDNLKRDWLHKSDDNKLVRADTAAIRLNKVLQVAGGSVISDSGVMYLDVAPRVQTCIDLVNESNSKTIIFANYRAIVERLHDEMKKHFGCVLIHGDVSAHERDRRFEAFRHDPKVQVLVAHPATTSHGLTLVEASTTIWFGPQVKNEIYDQANQRTDRPGQKHHMRIINLYGCREEELVYRSTREATKNQGDLLELKKLLLVDDIS